MPVKVDFDAELIAIIEGKIAEEPSELDGRKWATFIGQEDLAVQLGVVRETLSKRLAKPPFKRRVQRTKGVAYTFLRIAKADDAPDSPEEIERQKLNAIAKRMRIVWLKKIGEYPNQQQAGRIWGFAKDLTAFLADFPYVDPVEVFKHALNDWPDAATAIKLAAMAVPGRKLMHFDLPETGHICRFWKAVLHAYVMRLQWDGKVLNGDINATAAILQATEFDPIPEDVPYLDPEHTADLMAKKAAKNAAKQAAKAAQAKAAPTG